MLYSNLCIHLFYIIFLTLSKASTLSSLSSLNVACLFNLDSTLQYRCLFNQITPLEYFCQIRSNLTISLAHTQILKYMNIQIWILWNFLEFVVVLEAVRTIHKEKLWLYISITTYHKHCSFNSGKNTGQLNRLSEKSMLFIVVAVIPLLLLLFE